mmetsp:Transcript_9413/g.13515  ORF Transcript_9413/g.13515 Transcript_9413/m.13515 type:complete len:113 (+) Transcript_9413:116-454(+)
MTAAEEAKQLDTITDVVQEKELDSSRATQAMAALSIPPRGENDASSSADNAAALDNVVVSKEDVDIIVNELEIDEDLARMTLRNVMMMMQSGGCGCGEKEALKEALRRLIVS